MMREEFEQRTGFLPSQPLYSIIEKYYMNFDGDKDAFCKACPSLPTHRRGPLSYRGSAYPVSAADD